MSETKHHIHCGFKDPMDDLPDDSEHPCENCGAMLVACEKCDCLPPENYVKPGLQALMYVNAYEVTRHYGGPEEGGWWYNHLQPLASIPVLAMSHPYHDSLCYTCNQAQVGGKDMAGNLIKACKWNYHLIPHEDQTDRFKKHLEDIFMDVQHGNIYSVLGGAELSIAVEDHPPQESSNPHYE